MRAVKIKIRGIVQGVGFRPFVFRLARDCEILGNVSNDGEGVEIFAQGARIDEFLSRLKSEAPPMSRIHSIEVNEVECDENGKDFVIIASRDTSKTTAISPDLAICPDCIEEINNAAERRFKYPFTNCTNCGPRFSIIEDIPYDRKATTMRVFNMCGACQNEYENPLDRRFHAQPIACPNCGPQIWFENSNPSPQGAEGEPPETWWMGEAITQLKSGKILAIKGLSGFHLVCDATNESAVSLLRQRKRRPHKPMAIMLKSIAEVREWAQPNEAEIKALEHFSAPIVLIKGKDERLATSLAPNLNTIGIMIAATPLHYILCDAFGGPLIMTSGNLSGEPMVIDNDEAKEKLSPFVDGFLFHNRDIARRIDDSVVFVENNEIFVLRRARGFAPTPIHLPKGFENVSNTLALGAQMKSSICLLRNDEAIVSHYIGELGTSLANSELEKAIGDYTKLYDFTPNLIATDMHPQYFSTQIGEKIAEDLGIEIVGVQHHHAHIAAVLTENNWGLNDGKVLGLVFDGTGYGNDGNIWGGEFLIADYKGFERVGHVAPIRLPGGHAAINEPWRLLVAHLFEIYGLQKTKEIIETGIFGDNLKSKPIAQILTILDAKLNSPLCTSLGRLFDSVAAALGIAQNSVSYEAQAAIELENYATDCREVDTYKFENSNKINNQYILSLDQFWPSLIDDLKAGRSKTEIAFDFHFSLAKSCAKLAKIIAKANGIDTVAITGGVMQNLLFLRLLSKELLKQNLNVISNKLFPPNDGSIALGQALIAASKTKN